jgi:hypothetical protein
MDINKDPVTSPVNPAALAKVVKREYSEVELYGPGAHRICVCSHDDVDVIL